MADYTELLQALANQQQQYAQSNPYLIGGQTILKTPVQTTEQSDPLQTALVQALQGFIGSAATAYGGQQAKQQGLQLGQKFQSALQSPDPISALLADPELSDMGQIMMLQKASEEAAKTNKIALMKEQYKMENENKPPTLISDYGGKDILYKGAEKLSEAPHQDQSTKRLGIMSEPALDSTIDELRALYNLSPTQLPYGTTNMGVQQQIQIHTKSGENIRPPSAEEVKNITANDVFQTRIKELKELSKDVSEDGLKRVKQAAKMDWIPGSKLFADTESADYKFYALLKGAQQEYARTKDSGALNVFDVQLWGPLFEGIPLIDSKKAIDDRLNDIEKRQKEAKSLFLGNLKKGKVNTEGFDIQGAPQGGVSKDDALAELRRRGVLK